MNVPAVSGIKSQNPVLVRIVKQQDCNEREHGTTDANGHRINDAHIDQVGRDPSFEERFDGRAKPCRWLAAVALGGLLPIAKSHRSVQVCI